MPTVGIYVPMGISRTISQRWNIEPDHPLFEELVRSLCAEALEDEAGQAAVGVELDPLCPNKPIHKTGHRCRRCGGGR